MAVFVVRSEGANYEATPGGGAFYGKTDSFDALSLTARSSFDSFDASCL